MPINIHGKQYTTVSERVNMLVDDYKREHDIVTEIIKFDDQVVVMKATVTINNHVFTGHAYEKIGSSQVNTTSALENCETSCIGRALASAGYHGGEFASAGEVENAIHQQKSDKFEKYIPESSSANGQFDDSLVWFGAHKGKKWEEVPLNYLKKMAEWSGDITEKIPKFNKALEMANAVLTDNKKDIAERIEGEPIPF